jgi:DNA processing protein
VVDPLTHTQGASSLCPSKSLFARYFASYFKEKRRPPATAACPPHMPTVPALITSAKTQAESQLAWLALALTPGIGSIRLLRAIRRLRQPASLFQLSLTELEALEIPVEATRFIAEGHARQAAEQEWQRVEQTGGAILTYSDPEYPERLKQIFDPPAVLWIRGSQPLLSRPAIAVVGTRHPTPYGSGMAEMLARDLASRKLTILSGMARGVDTAAHKGALAAGGATVAVWGTGIDVIYPKENKRLAEDILSAGGTIVSEYPIGTFPAPQNFPRRNRILSGMSIGVLVIEAGEHSGTRVTARCAIEQNRDVFAVPGNVTNKNSWGPNTLIKQGAKLTATWEDVWEDLPSQIRLQLEEELGFASNGTPDASLFRDSPMGDQESMVLALLRHDESLQLDEIIERLEEKLSSAEIFTALFELELGNHIKQLPGKHYVRRM